MDLNADHLEIIATFRASQKRYEEAGESDRDILYHQMKSDEERLQRLIRTMKKIKEERK